MPRRLGNVSLAALGRAAAAVGKGEVLRRARAMFRALELGNVELSIVLTGDAEIRRLNRLYRHQDRPTDVLAFAMREGVHAGAEKELLGDIVVSVPRARAQARERGVTLLAEVTMLVAHGLLHLLGWDHDTPAKDRRMRAETERLCALAVAPSVARKQAAAMTHTSEHRDGRGGRDSAKPRPLWPSARDVKAQRYISRSRGQQGRPGTEGARNHKTPRFSLAGKKRRVLRISPSRRRASSAAPQSRTKT